MPTSPTAVTPLPTPPTTADPVNFDTRMDATLLAQQAMVPQINAQNTVAFNNATEAAASATAAAGSLTTIGGSVTAAANSATAAGNSATAAAGSVTTAQAAATAAGASAGLPALVANSFLQVSAGGVLSWLLKSAETTWLTAVNGLAKALAYTFVNKGTVAAAGTAAFLFSDGETQSVTAAGNLTVTVGGWPATGRRAELELQCINFGGKTITWPALRWIIAGGGFTTVASGNGVTFQTAGTDYVLLWTDDGGTTVYAKVLR